MVSPSGATLPGPGLDPDARVRVYGPGDLTASSGAPHDHPPRDPAAHPTRQRASPARAPRPRPHPLPEPTALRTKSSSGTAGSCVSPRCDPHRGRGPGRAVPRHRPGDPLFGAAVGEVVSAAPGTGLRPGPRLPLAGLARVRARALGRLLHPPRRRAARPGRAPLPGLGTATPPSPGAWRSRRGHGPRDRRRRCRRDMADRSPGSSARAGSSAAPGRGAKAALVANSATTRPSSGARTSPSPSSSPRPRPKASTYPRQRRRRAAERGGRHAARPECPVRARRRALRPARPARNGHQRARGARHAYPLNPQAGSHCAASARSTTRSRAGPEPR